jgi:small multidrug resistance pump
MGTWVMLGVAIALEVTATLFLRVSDGFSRLWPSLIVIVGYGASFVLLSFIMKTGIAIGIIYAIWSAFGVTFVTLLGMLVFDDKISRVTAIGMVIVVVGVVLVQAGTRGEVHL